VEDRPTGTSRSTGKIEIAGKLIQSAIRKYIEHLDEWDISLGAATRAVNPRNGVSIS
jgi:hypothetical protein